MERVSWQPLALLLAAAAAVASGTEVGYDGRSMVIDGERRLLISGSIHYPRSTPEEGQGGRADAIETYVFWNGHEPRRRQYNFEGSYDIVRFFKEVQDAGMYAILRIGPYICGEWNYGGLPAWLRDISGMQFRMHNNPFEQEMETFTTLIVDKLKEAKMFAGQGGPIILSQYHGGTNFGRTSGGPYITTSYDYDALLMSNIRQPKYGHLKDLHNVLKSMEKILLHGDYKDTTMGNTNVMVTKYTLDNLCLLHQQQVRRQGGQCDLDDGRHPCRVQDGPWSILPDCKTVA
ncbi:hypothetical protein ZWY2020_015110 [Hordeum vulgare]|nr:hypothetical protein ZWY2020_015110 [Hordeum vulgare]